MAVAEQFLTKWNFPHCLGSIDGKRADNNTRKIVAACILTTEAHSVSCYSELQTPPIILYMQMSDARVEFLMVACLNIPLCTRKLNKEN